MYSDFDGIVRCGEGSCTVILTELLDVVRGSCTVIFTELLDVVRGHVH